MSQEEPENQGTGVADVFDILVKTPHEKLLSLTYKLGESPEEKIIEALCLIVLQKAQALDKLQRLRDNCLANHLTENYHITGGKLKDFGDNCVHLQELTGESLAVLARIFKVLSEKKMCDPLLRDLAYQRALSNDSKQTSGCEDLKYDQLREEAKDVCGSQFAELVFSPKDLKSGYYSNPHRSLDEGSPALGVTLSQDQLEQANSSVPSYPTHLEISMPPTVCFPGDNLIPETSDETEVNTPTPLVGNIEAKNAPGQSSESFEEPQFKSNEPAVIETKRDSMMDEADCMKLVSHTTQPETSDQTTEPKSAPPNTLLPNMPVPNEMHESKGAEEEEEEEEAIFYAFVILHAPEDADLAGIMRLKLEMVTGCNGVTFSEEFAIPGRTALSCVEDAVNNSAFIFLLLTHNFKTRMQQIEAESALMNSINKEHKFNTVIPLLPRENGMPRHSISLVLQAIVPLEDDGNFERKIRRVLSPLKIQKQKEIWTREQRLKSLTKRQNSQKQMIQEHKACRERVNLRVCDGRAFCQPQPSIHIQNAKYIMIGDNSQMTVDLGGGADKGKKDVSVQRKEEQ